MSVQTKKANDMLKVTSLTEEELEGPLVRLPVAPVEFILMKFDFVP